MSAWRPAARQHGPHTGQHSHSHPAYGVSPDDDGEHSHSHDHGGDGSHDHDHEGIFPGSEYWQRGSHTMARRHPLRGAAPPEHPPVRTTHHHRHQHPDGDVPGLDDDNCHAHRHSHGKKPDSSGPPGMDNDHDHPGDHDEGQWPPGEAAEDRQRGSTMARRYVPRSAAAAEDLIDRLAGTAFSVAPGQVTRQLRAEFLMGKARRAAELPGAKLDGYAWASSWGAFLTAISDRRDEAGAQALIRGVMQDARPRNTLGERVPAEGGFLVPERLRSQVLAYMTAGIVRPRSTYVPMDSLRVPVPLLDNPSQASGGQALGGLTFALVEEGAPIPASVPDFGRVVLEARKLAALLQSVPNELVSDSPAFTDDFLPRVIAMGCAWYEDDLMIYTGSGTGEPQALVNAPGAYAVTRNTPDEVLHLDIVTMLKALHPASKASATWLLSESAFDQLLELYEISGTAPAGQDIAPPQTLVYDMSFGCWRLLGVPAVVNDHQPAVGTAGDVILADLGLYLVGDRGEMTVERSDMGPGFISDTSDFRIRSRVDGRYWPQSTITLTTGQQVSGLVVLH
jgi:HK97 family phage major capsid protein